MNSLITLIQQYGAGFVFLNVLALQAGLPVPAYPALIVAGAYAAMRLRYAVFVFFDAIGAGLWVGVGVALGYVFRDAISDVMATLSALGQYGLMLIILGFAIWIAVKWWQRRLFVKQLRMDRVSVEELRRLMEEKKLTAIVDVRSPMMQASTGRIPGARTIDIHKIAESFQGV